MTVHDIENLSAAELKAQRDDLIKSLADAKHDELAARYVQARTDAKLRDEKLAEQGRTITALTQGNEAMTAKVAALESVLRAAEAGSATFRKEHDALKAKGDELQTKLTGETARAERLKAEAIRNAQALSTAEKALKDAMAESTILAAEKGE